VSDSVLVDPGDAFVHAPMGIAVTTTRGVLTTVNRALGRLLGRSPAGLEGRSLFDFTHPEDLPGARAACRALAQHRSALWRHECRLVDAAGQAVPVQVATSWVQHEDAGTTSYLVMVIDDISERRAAEARLLHRAAHDPLTGLANRLLFDDRLRHALQRGRRDGTSTCVVMIDLDHFKAVNDRHGHLFGDEVLTAFAGRLESVLRASDTPARFGGDEFAIVCEDTRPRDAEALVQRLHTALAAPLRVGGSRVPLGFSAGVGHAAGDGEVSPEEVLRAADRRMYEHKGRTGR
jgi:diguanylate cyclase (GGDEF)-like protein/PAS domain S-box-containing protein